MTKPITLKGMTWSHPRGYDPVVACAELYRKETGVKVEWDKRSLQDFESFPVEELARAYDLIVIDHPHVGQITKEGCLAPLDVPGREAEREALAAGSVGKSYPSYTWQGHQWAFPIDAATPVLAYRPDLIAAPPKTWDEVLALGAGKALVPFRAPHSLMSFYSLAANLGRPCDGSGEGDLIDPAVGVRVYEFLAKLAANGMADFDSDPIQVFEKLAAEGSDVAVAPLLYGYVSYATDGFRPNRLAFADMPVLGTGGPVGSALGGTGIAVSAYSENRDAAIDFAYWLAGADVQRGPYASNGGQPGHATAWEDPAVNAPTHGFYENTRPTLEGAWVRPRHNGYMAFQDAASKRINAALQAGEAGDAVIAELNRMFRDSFANA